MKNKLLNIVLIVIFVFFFIHFLKDITQDVLKIKTPLDYFGNVNEDLSLFSSFIKSILNGMGYLSFFGEIFLIIAIPIHIFRKKKDYLLKSIWIITALIIVYFLVATFLDPRINIYLNKKFSNTFSIYIIEGQIYHLLQAKTPVEWTKGLMYYKNKSELEGADGMIFIFPVKMVQSFWNKNTYVDLDIYWMDGDKIVGKSYLPSVLKSKKIVVVNSGKKVDRVVELIN